MKKLILILFLCSTVFGWSYTYNITTPAGSDDPKQADDRMREIKAAVQERQNIDHYWPLTTNQVSDANSGQHRKITFFGPIAKPTVQADHSYLYLKTVSSISELYWLDENDTERQFTTGSYLKGAAVEPNGIDDTKIRLRNNQPLRAYDAAGTGYVDLIKANSDGNCVLPDQSCLDSDTAPIADNDIVNKKYVDDQVAANVEVISSSQVAFVGDTIIKYGNHTGADGTDSVTFPVAFPNNCYQVIACIGNSTGGAADGIYVYNISKTGFSIYARTNAQPARWMAIGD